MIICSITPYAISLCSRFVVVVAVNGPRKRFIACSGC